MSRTIVLDEIEGVEAAALMVDGKLHDLLVDIAPGPRIGTIYRAICDRPLKGQGGMMLRLTDGETAFLRQGKGLAPGQAILVQVTGYAVDGKAVPVTQKVLFKSRYAIATPGAPGVNISRQIHDEEVRVAIHDAVDEIELPEGMGLILRSCCAAAEAVKIAEDAANMAGLAEAVLSDTGKEAELLVEGEGPHGLAWREWSGPIVEDGFEDEGVWDALSDLAGPVVHLSAGASIIIESTRALVAVDVNTGGDTSIAAGLKANIEAARALPRALRLRGLGGQVVVDMAPMPKGQRRQVDVALKAAFKADNIDTIVVGWTTLGLMELQRKRERWPLDAYLAKIAP